MRSRRRPTPPAGVGRLLLLLPSAALLGLFFTCAGGPRSLPPPHRCLSQAHLARRLGPRSHKPSGEVISCVAKMNPSMTSATELLALRCMEIMQLAGADSEYVASSSSSLGALFLCFMGLATVTTMAATPRKPIDVPYQKNYVPTWANDRINYINGGNEVQLTLDKYTGTGFQSKGSYLFGHFSMQMKLVPGDSAGTVTAFYLSEHDEIDFPGQQDQPAIRIADQCVHWRKGR